MHELLMKVSRMHFKSYFSAKAIVLRSMGNELVPSTLRRCLRKVYLKISRAKYLSVLTIYERLIFDPLKEVKTGLNLISQ